ncbi:hypothetical protein [Methanosarcina sp.]|uniref:hypothetical protein n=1 Tax=Methanosarcina sp. TaxID=2213 RepID=UPI00298969A8|nr:hypothetical protein [Methanosarcina sp.]MDW5552184.1 hypothetical protein [Methanosarcina sp.]MDW5555959.1 hypothetical protein [Methanosarcina sp.]MDW5559546.1 hypothetical protein [Methanosarcina sp.]
MSEQSERKGHRPPETGFGFQCFHYNSALLSERSERKGHRPPETGLGAERLIKE